MLKSKHLSVNRSQLIRFSLSESVLREFALITLLKPTLNNPLQIQLAKLVAIKPRLNSPRKLGAVSEYILSAFRKFPVNLQAPFSGYLNAVLKVKTRLKFRNPPLRFVSSETPFSRLTPLKTRTTKRDLKSRVKRFFRKSEKKFWHHHLTKFCPYGILEKQSQAKK